jgi:hypothetical protein
MFKPKFTTSNCKEICWGNPGRSQQLSRICAIRMGKRTKKDIENCTCKECIIKVNCSTICQKRKNYRHKVKRKNLIEIQRRKKK